MTAKPTTTLREEGREFIKADQGSHEDPYGYQLRYYLIDPDDDSESGGTLPISATEAVALAFFILRTEDLLPTTDQTTRQTKARAKRLEQFARLHNQRDDADDLVSTIVGTLDGKTTRAELSAKDLLLASGSLDREARFQAAQK